jgi:lipoyl(octanoyl) transferase
MTARARAVAGLQPGPLHGQAGGYARVQVRYLGRRDYAATLEAMRAFTASRTDATPDELWVLEHPPVYTVGQAGRPEHLPRGETGGPESPIPVERIDRGGQITYHGPGQVVVYALVDIARRGLKVREFVCLLEESVIDLLAGYDVASHRRDGAPGVYAGGAKIAALGLRIRSGRSYHGLSLNVDMDLRPFAAIDPCGYPGLAVTQTRDLGIDASPATLGAALAERIAFLLDGPR